MLQEMYGIVDYTDLNDCFYIAINQDKMKLPVTGRLSNNGQVAMP